MTDSRVEIKVPEDLIKTLVATEIANAISKDGGAERFVELVVQQAVIQKKNNYDSRSILDDAFHEMVRKEAVNVMQAWIEQNRSMLHDAMIRFLNDKKRQYIGLIAERLVAGLAYIDPKIHLHILDGSNDINETIVMNKPGDRPCQDNTGDFRRPTKRRK